MPSRIPPESAVDTAMAASFAAEGRSYLSAAESVKFSWENLAQTLLTPENPEWRSPFSGYLLSRLPRQPDSSIPTLAVRSDLTLIYNPRFLDRPDLLIGKIDQSCGSCGVSCLC